MAVVQAYDKLLKEPPCLQTTQARGHLPSAQCGATGCTVTVASWPTTAPHLSLFQASFPLDMLEHVAACGILHGDGQVVLCEEHLLELDDVRMKQVTAQAAPEQLI